MRTFTIFGFLCLISLSLSSCAILPEPEQTMKVHQGMSSSEIIELFGKPQNINVAVCGKSPNQWTCTTWEYNQFIDGRATFTFSGKPNSLKLNNFDIHRDGF